LHHIFKNCTTGAIYPGIDGLCAKFARFRQAFPPLYWLTHSGRTAGQGINHASGWRSHGCVRLFVSDAEWLSKQFVEPLNPKDHFLGTEVVIEPYGKFSHPTTSNVEKYEPSI